MANEPVIAPVIELGPLSHIGIAVEDCEAAAAWWERVFGVGPFSTDTYILDASTNFHFKGKPAEAKMKASIAYSGKVFIELVEVLEGESPHTEFLRERGEGIQHVAFNVRDIHGSVEKLKAEGLEPILQYKFQTNFGGHDVEVEEVYLNSAKFIGGSTIQLMEITPL